jgi:PAS domain S-box-containing protein
VNSTDHKTENDPVVGIPPTLAVAQQMLEYAPVAMLLVNNNGEIQHLNSAAEQLFGYSKENLIGRQVETLVPDELGKEHELLRDGFMDASTRHPMGIGRHLSALHKDGHLIHVEVALHPLTIGSESAVMVVSVLDHTARDRAEHAELFVLELKHRAKNMFAVISAISHQIGAKSLSQADFESAFDNRLRSFAASYDLLARENWQAPKILDLVRSQLAFANGQDASSIEIEGPNLRLSASHAEYLGLAIHELATNALKHGALSIPSGKLRIRWAVDKTTNRFQFDWQELGGPPVAFPERKGFGRIILESVVPETFLGMAELHTPPTGITWHLDAPMKSIISGAQCPIP